MTLRVFRGDRGREREMSRKLIPLSPRGRKYGWARSSPSSSSAPSGGSHTNWLLVFLSQLQFQEPQVLEGVHSFVDVTECVEVPSAQRKASEIVSLLSHFVAIACRLSGDEPALRQNVSIPLKSSGRVDCAAAGAAAGATAEAATTVSCTRVCGA
jgi:hypothetical protein